MKKNSLQTFISNAKPFVASKIYAYFGFLLLISGSLIVRMDIEKNYLFLGIYVCILLSSMIFVIIDFSRSKRAYFNVHLGASLMILIVIFMWDTGMYYFGFENDPSRLKNILLVGLSQLLDTILLFFYLKFMIYQNNRNNYRSYKSIGDVIVFIVILIIVVAPVLANENIETYLLIYILFGILFGALSYSMVQFSMQSLVYRKLKKAGIDIELRK